MRITPGIDYAWARPSIRLVVASGDKWVGRYASRDTTGKSITRHEATAIDAAALACVIFFEDGAQNVLGGAPQGLRDASFSLGLIRACGYSPPFAALWTVDFQTSAWDWPAIDAYAAQFGRVFGYANTGPYGSFVVVERYRRRGFGLAAQTAAWSGGLWSPLAQIRQGGMGMGGQVDEDTARGSWFGQMRMHAPAPPPHPAPPPPHPAPTPVLSFHQHQMLLHFVRTQWAKPYQQAEWTKITSDPAAEYALWQRLFGKVKA